MKKTPSYEKEYTESFIKAAQYIVGLTARQDVLEHLGKVMAHYFQAEWVAFVGYDAAKELTLHGFSGA